MRDTRTATVNGDGRHASSARPERRPWHKQLYVWVLIGIAVGIVVGAAAPKVGIGLQPVGNAFVSLIKMVITPVIFCTVVVGIASVDSLRRVGRIGIKTIGYFELVTTAALALGLVVMNVLKPGAGVHARPSHIDVTSTVGGFIAQGHHQHWFDPIINAVPDSVVGAFSTGNVLQVLVFAVLFGVALNQMGSAGKTVVGAIDMVGKAIFGVVRRPDGSDRLLVQPRRNLHADGEDGGEGTGIADGGRLAPLHHAQADRDRAGL